jgi:hypothetical protein
MGPFLCVFWKLSSSFVVAKKLALIDEEWLALYGSVFSGLLMIVLTVT